MSEPDHIPKLKRREAENLEDFSAFKIAWIAWPERQFIIPVKKCIHVPAQETFDLVVDYRGGTVQKDATLPDFPLKRLKIPRPFMAPAILKTRDGLKMGLQDVFIGPSPSVGGYQGTVWLIPEKAKLIDGQIPHQRLDFRAHFIGGDLKFSENPPSTLTDINGPCEATFRLKTTSSISVWGDWVKPVGLGQHLLNALEIGVALGGIAINEMNAKAAEDAALARKSGQLFSRHSYPVLFDSIFRQIRDNPVGPAMKGQVQADPEAASMTVTYTWIEMSSSVHMPDVAQRIDLHLKFHPSEQGTTVDFEWVDFNMPRGLKNDQTIRTINTWIRNLAGRA